jgi:hypothetical protein
VAWYKVLFPTRCLSLVDVCAIVAAMSAVLKYHCCALSTSKWSTAMRLTVHIHPIILDMFAAMIDENKHYFYVTDDTTSPGSSAVCTCKYAKLQSEEIRSCSLLIDTQEVVSEIARGRLSAEDVARKPITTSCTHQCVGVSNVAPQFICENTCGKILGSDCLNLRDGLLVVGITSGGKICTTRCDEPARRLEIEKYDGVGRFAETSD